MKRVLEDWWCLDTHPFEPDRDRRRNFDFRRQGVSLENPLDVFYVNELVHYYARIGAFGDAEKEIRHVLQTLRYPGGGVVPPAVLIEGANGAGRSSLANLIAYIVQDRWRAVDPDRAKDAQLLEVPVTGENFAKLLFTIKQSVQQHADECGLQACQSIFRTWSDEAVGGANNPEEGYLETFLLRLKQCMRAAPPLILLIEPIKYQQREWVNRLHAILAPLNIMPIFTTENPNVTAVVRGSISQSRLRGVTLCLRGLTEQETCELLMERLATFRPDGAPPDRQDLFPFAPEAIEQAFRDQANGLPIKLALMLLRDAFNAKLSELAELPEDPTPARDALLVRWEDFVGSYSEKVRQATQRRN
jgi:hypothetical protein